MMRNEHKKIGGQNEKGEEGMKTGREAEGKVRRKGGSLCLSLEMLAC